MKLYLAKQMKDMMSAMVERLRAYPQQTVKGSDHSGYNIVTQQRCQNLLLSFGFKIDAT